MKTWIICALLLATASHVRAEGTEIDVRSFEFLDVIETTDGNVWKGVVIEQTPNVSYKIALAGGSIHVIPAADVQRMSKQRNGDFKTSRATATREDGVEQSYEQSAKLPAPYANSSGPARRATRAWIHSGSASRTSMPSASGGPRTARRRSTPTASCWMARRSMALLHCVAR